MKIGMIVFPDFALADNFTNTPEAHLRIHKLMKRVGVKETYLFDLRNSKDMEDYMDKLAGLPELEYYMFSATTSQAGILNETVMMMKMVFPKSVFIVGGPHVNSIYASNTWRGNSLFTLHPHINLFVQGYFWNDCDMASLLDFILDNKVGANSRSIYVPSTPTDISNAVVELDYEVLGEHCTCKGGVIDKYRTEKVQNIHFSTGCYARCAFCYNPYRCYTAIPPDKVVNEIKRRVSKYGVTSLKINDDNPFVDREWNEEFIRNYSIPNGYDRPKLLASVRCDTNNDKLEQLRKLSVLGVTTWGIGVEWGSDEVLNKANKGTSVYKLKTMIKYLGDYTDSDIHLYTIFGLPPMNTYTMQDMIDFIQWCTTTRVSSISMTALTPLPATDMYENPHRYGMQNNVPINDGTPIDWDRFNFVSDFNSIRAKPTGMNDVTYLQYKLLMYQTLDKCGYLREETRGDIIKAGYKI